MLYDIKVKTTCEYEWPAAGRQALRLLPMDEKHSQRLVLGSIDISPAPSERHDRFDFFGNQTTDICLEDPIKTLELTVRARVDRVALPPGMDVSTSMDRLAAELSANRSLDGLSPHHFVGPSPLVGASKPIRDYARDVIPQAASVMDFVRQLNNALYKDMTYDGEATEVDTPLEEAFAKRRGVCQDFTHIMIACLREVGIPAGYVSGMLRTEPPPGKPRLEGADAMHAWVQAWCGAAAGWVDFDPTNALIVGADHIVVARGRDYSDVSPVRGVLRTSGAQEISQSVDVIPLG